MIPCFAFIPSCPVRQNAGALGEARILTDVATVKPLANLSNLCFKREAFSSEIEPVADSETAELH